MARRSHNWLFYGGVVLFVALLVLVGGRWFRQQPDSVGPLLHIPDRDLHIAPVLAQPAFKHAMVVQNAGDRPVSIDRFLSSCSCVAVTPPSLQLEPGQSSTINLTLNLTHYLRLSKKEAISARVRVTPVIDGVSGRGWMLDVDVIRPKIYSLSSEVDFGLVSASAEQVTSVETIFVTESCDDASVTTDSALIERGELIPVATQQNGRRACQLRLLFSKQHRPFEETAFHATVSAGPGSGDSVMLPCRVRFDSGLRADIVEMPPTIIEPERAVSWIVTIYSVRGPLRDGQIRIGQRKGDFVLDIHPDQAEESRYRFRCEMIPSSEGDLSVELKAVGEVEEGIFDTRSVLLRFYSLAPSLESKG